MSTNARSYRESHAAAGYGRIYEKTYEEGYYHELWNQVERPLLRKILERHAEAGASSYLDFACGSGRILGEAESVFERSSGVDVSDAMLTIARERCPNSTLIQRDLTRFPLANRFDVATAFRFFLNAEEELRVAALRALHGHLRPGGVLIANIHVNSSSPLGLFYRARNLVGRRANTMSHGDFCRLVTANGFAIETTHWYGYLPRTGWYLSSLPKRLLGSTERWCVGSRWIPRSWAQGFLVECRRTSADYSCSNHA